MITTHLPVSNSSVSAGGVCGGAPYDHAAIEQCAAPGECLSDRPVRTSQTTLTGPFPDRDPPFPARRLPSGVLRSVLSAGYGSAVRGWSQR